MTHAIVADLGGTFLRYALADERGLSDVRVLRLDGDARSRERDLWTTIVDTLADYAASRHRDLGDAGTIVLAFPGPVDAAGEPVTAPTLFGGGRAVPRLRALLARRTGHDVFLLNDVSAAAYRFAETIAAERFGVVTVSSGIGWKCFDRARSNPVLDDVHHAGEIGHIVVDGRPDAVTCDCGGRGHLGALASGRGIEALARRTALARPEAFAASACVTSFGAAPQTLTNEAHLVPALLAGDSWAARVLSEGVRPLALVLASIAVGAGLDRIAVMGGFAQRLGEIYRSALRDAVSAATAGGSAAFGTSQFFVIAAPDAMPALEGAAAFARRRAGALA